MKQTNDVDHVKNARQPAAAAPPSWWPRRLTRHQVSTALQTSIGSVRRLEGKTLHPVRGDDGAWGFDPAEIAAIAAASKDANKSRVPPSAEAALAAEVFTLFNARRPFREVVTIVRQPPHVVRALYKEWHEDGDLWVSRHTVKEIRARIFQAWPDQDRPRIRNAEDLVSFISGLLDELRDSAGQLDERDRQIAELRAWKKQASEKIANLRASSARPAEDQYPRS
jgi:hypothetical protein